MRREDLQWFPIHIEAAAVFRLGIQGLHQLEHRPEIPQQLLLLRLLRYLIATEEAGIFMPQADDLLDQVKLSFGQDDPVVEAAPFIEVVFKHADRPLKRDILLRTGSVAPATALTLPIPSLRV